MYLYKCSLISQPPYFFFPAALFAVPLVQGTSPRLFTSLISSTSLIYAAFHLSVDGVTVCISGRAKHLKLLEFP